MNTAAIAAHGKSFYRNWTCQCGYKCTTPVVLSDHTPEKIPLCPKCSKKPLHGSAAYQK